MRYGIIIEDGYLTINGFGKDFSYTKNRNFAYVYDSEEQIKKVLDGLKIKGAKIIKF